MWLKDINQVIKSKNVTIDGYLNDVEENRRYCIYFENVGSEVTLDDLCNVKISSHNGNVAKNAAVVRTALVTAVTDIEVNN